ncbi:MAG: hypothetical protein Q4E69_03500 [Bacilli bacterium]|nr:hypothetical protein [Bacilli bacterium]
MPKIISGDIKNMYISKLELRDKNFKNLVDSNIKFHFGEVLVEKDSEFYGNLCHMIVNFRYDNVLATREEAMDYLKDVFLGAKNKVLTYMRDNNIEITEDLFDKMQDTFNSSILFVDYDKLKLRAIVDKKTLKEKKKMYKLHK